MSALQHVLVGTATKLPIAMMGTMSRLAYRRSGRAFSEYALRSGTIHKSSVGRPRSHHTGLEAPHSSYKAEIKEIISEEVATQYTSIAGVKNAIDDARVSGFTAGLVFGLSVTALVFIVWDPFFGKDSAKREGREEVEDQKFKDEIAMSELERCVRRVLSEEKSKRF